MGTLSSTIQIAHAGSDLVLRFPPEYLAAIPLAIFGLPMAIIFAVVIKNNGLRPLSFLLMLGFIPLVLCVYMITSSSTLLFSQQQGTLTMMDSAFFRTTTQSWPLSEVERVEIAEDDGHSHMLYVVLGSGRRIPTGSGWTARKGFGEAEQTANQYLGQVRTAASAPAGTNLPKRSISVEQARREFIKRAQQQQQHR